jgi:hypothetical protein
MFSWYNLQKGLDPCSSSVLRTLTTQTRIPQTRHVILDIANTSDLVTCREECRSTFRKVQYVVDFLNINDLYGRSKYRVLSANNAPCVKWKDAFIHQREEVWFIWAGSVCWFVTWHVENVYFVSLRIVISVGDRVAQYSDWLRVGRLVFDSRQKHITCGPPTPSTSPVGTGLKRPRRETNQSPLSSAQIKILL